MFYIHNANARELVSSPILTSIGMASNVRYTEKRQPLVGQASQLSARRLRAHTLGCSPASPLHLRTNRRGQHPRSPHLPIDEGRGGSAWSVRLPLASRWQHQGKPPQPHVQKPPANAPCAPSTQGSTHICPQSL